MPAPWTMANGDTPRRRRTRAAFTRAILLTVACTVGVLAGSPGAAAATVPHDPAGGTGDNSAAAAPPAVYDLAADWRLAPHQANPSPVRGVPVAKWSYLYSAANPATPADYHLMTRFTTRTHGIAGLQAWSGPSTSATGHDLPSVGFNATGHAITVHGTVWPAGTVLIHPSLNQSVIVAFQIPAAGYYRLGYKVTLARTPDCTQGITYVMNKSDALVANGTLLRAETQRGWTLEHMDKYQRVFLIITSQNDPGCDATLTDVTITPQH